MVFQKNAIGIVALMVLLFFSMASCVPQTKGGVGEGRADSLRMANEYFFKMKEVEALDSVEWYAEKACSYLQKEEQKAIVYYNWGERCVQAGELERASGIFQRMESAMDWRWQRMLINSLAKAYAQRGNYRKAMRVIDSIYNSRTSRKLVPYYLLVKGTNYAMIGYTDSAFSYYNEASQSLNPWVAQEAIRRIALHYASIGKDSLAYEAMLDEAAGLESKLTSEEYRESKMKYEDEKMKNELNQLKMAKQRRDIVLLMLSLVMVSVGFAFYYFWQRRKQMTDKLLLHEQQVRLEQANRLLEQERELVALHEKEAQLRESLFRRMKSFHKIPSLEENAASDNEEEEGRRIALSAEEWEEIRLTIDKSYENFTTRLRSAYPVLSEKDVNFCCLIKIGVSIKDLSDIYCISRTSVSRKKQRLKREKFGLTAEDDTLDSFLRHF